jgi:hypothetical protein
MQLEVAVLVPFLLLSMPLEVAVQDPFLVVGLLLAVPFEQQAAMQPQVAVLVPFLLLEAVALELILAELLKRSLELVYS